MLLNSGPLSGVRFGSRCRRYLKIIKRMGFIFWKKCMFKELTEKLRIEHVPNIFKDISIVIVVSCLTSKTFLYILSMMKFHSIYLINTFQNNYWIINADNMNFIVLHGMRRNIVLNTAVYMTVYKIKFINIHVNYR